MGRRALIPLAIALPWLALLPIANALLATALFALALAAAFHGWGRLLVADATTAIQTGIAIAIGLAGIAMLLHHYAAWPIIIGGLALHTAFVGRAFATSWFGVVPQRAPVALAPIALLAVVGAIAVLGAAGDTGARPFDDDGHLLGALRGLADTGFLGDPTGYPRAYQLGGFPGIAGLVTALGDVHAVRMIDALALVLALAYAQRRADPLWGVLLVVAGAALAMFGPEPCPIWLGVGLMLPLVAADAPPLALGAMGGALIALRHAYAPFAIIALVRACRRDRRRALAIAGAALAVTLPYALARHVPPVKFSIGALIGNGRYLWAMAIALAILQRRQLLLALVLVVAIYDGQTTSGRAGWYRRTALQLDSIGYLARTRLGPPRDLDAILAAVPETATVALWVPEPERFDHARHHVVDLRTPRIAAFRDRHAALAGAQFLVYAPDGTFDDLPPIARRDGLLLIRLATP